MRTNEKAIACNNRLKSKTDFADKQNRAFSISDSTTFSNFPNAKTQHFSEAFYRERLAFWRYYSLKNFDLIRRRRCCFCHRGWECPTFEIADKFVCSRDLKMALRIADAWRREVANA